MVGRDPADHPPAALSPYVTDSPLPGPRTPPGGVVRAASVRLGLPFVSAYRDGAWSVLGDPSRRAIFELLARRPSSVQQLADQLPISRPAVSQHLRVLKDGGLVTSEADGTRRIYRLNPGGVGALRAWLDGVWAQALAGFQKAAEASARLDQEPTLTQQEPRHLDRLDGGQSIDGAIRGGGGWAKLLDGYARAVDPT